MSDTMVKANLHVLDGAQKKDGQRVGVSMVPSPLLRVGFYRNLVLNLRSLV